MRQSSLLVSTMTGLARSFPWVATLPSHCLGFDEQFFVIYLRLLCRHATCPLSRQTVWSM